MKRDLKINFGVLDSLLGELYEFRQAVENMQDGVRKLDALLAEAEGEAFDAIRARKIEIEEHLQRYHEQTDDVFRLVEDYTAEMTHYIKPFHRHEMMRVDRDDIWFNLLSMQAALAPLRLVQDMLLSTHPRYEPDEAVREQIEHARRHNMDQIDSIEWRVRNLESKLSNQVEIMKHAYGVRIVPFENTDDAYKKRAQEVYDKYTNFWERMNNVARATDKAVGDFGNGLLQSVVDTVVGLVKLPYGLVQYVADGSVILFCKMIGSPVPSWAGKHFNGTNDMISSVVNDPFLLIEGLAQGISDTYEDKGIVYMSGYVAGEALQIYMAKRFSNRAKGSIPIYDELDNQLEGINAKVNKLESSDAMNEFWKGKRYTGPPYAPESVVQRLELLEDTKFVRVYDGVNTDLPGGWVMRADDIKGLTPAQIQAKYALPFEPVFVGEVIVPAGSNINIGIANELFGYPGGGIQIDLNYKRVGEFKELGEILKWNLE